MHYTALERLVLDHLERYPLLQIMDVYRLLHQSCVGAVYAVTQLESARDWLVHELALDPPRREEALSDPLGLKGELVRLHLRPYLALGGTVDPLLAAMQASAKDYRPHLDDLPAYWGAVQAMAEAGHLPEASFSAREVALFGRVYAGWGWCAAGHSPLYCHTYKPLYRVLQREAAERLVADLGGHL
jgi:hypothetical protein